MPTTDVLRLVKEATTPNPDPRAVSLITDPTLFLEVLHNAGPHLYSPDPNIDLQELYRVGWHHQSGSLIIANTGAILYCLSPRTRSPYLAWHQGMAIYRPSLGVEFINVALIGDVYNKPLVVRSESACSPSFLLGSQRCNCRHQWESAQELAAFYNPSTTPDIANGHNFETWVQHQAKAQDGHVTFTNSGPVGFVLLHIDTQNGMGSGYTPGVFATDLYTRASLRHRGEYTAEQILGVSMGGAFDSLGLIRDPRSAEGGLGYETPFIALDFLQVSSKLTLLSNNPLKWKHRAAKPYDVTPLGMRGEINTPGQEEALSRAAEFAHCDIGDLITFEDEFTTLTTQIGNLTKASK